MMIGAPKSGAIMMRTPLKEKEFGFVCWNTLLHRFRKNVVVIMNDDVDRFTLRFPSFL